MLVSSYHFLQGPLIAVAALGVIVLMMRWVFSTDHRSSRSASVSGTRDYGLLQPVCTARSAEEAAALRDRLAQAGIRCTVTAGPDAVALLVFRDDAARARELVGS